MKNKKILLWRQAVLPSLSLFTSIGTLLCCALPALLVALGMGAVLAGFISAVPWVTEISQHKAIVFTVAGGLIFLAGYMQWRAKGAPCPADPLKAAACNRLRKVSGFVLLLSAILYVVGFFFAFVAVHVLF